MAAAATNLALDLKLMRASGLGHVYGLFSTKMECYAEATMSGYPESVKKTPTDSVGDCNPTWDYTLKFNIPVSATDPVVEVVIRCKTGYGHDKDIRKVSILVKHLLINAACSVSSPSSESYAVMRETREPMGLLHFTYKFSNPSSAPPLQHLARQYGNPSPPVVAVYPPPQVPEQYGSPSAAVAAYPPPLVPQQNGIFQPPITSYPPPQVPQQYGSPSPPVAVYPPPPMLPQNGISSPPNPPHQQVPQQYGIPSPTDVYPPSLVPQQNGSQAYYPHLPSPLYGMTSSSHPYQGYSMVPPVTVYPPPPWTPQSNPSPPVLPQTYSMASPPATDYPPSSVMQQQYGTPSPASSAYPPRSVVAYMEPQFNQPDLQQPHPPTAVAASNGAPPTVASPTASPPVVRPPPGPRPAIQSYATQHPPGNGMLKTAIGGVLVLNALASLPENLSSASENLFGDGGWFDFDFDLF